VGLAEAVIMVCLSGIGADGFKIILFFPPLVSVVPIKHCQLVKSPDSKSRLGGQDWLFALEKKQKKITIQTTNRDILKGC
jgi:hypothetical protein